MKRWSGAKAGRGRSRRHIVGLACRQPRVALWDWPGLDGLRSILVQSRQGRAGVVHFGGIDDSVVVGIQRGDHQWNWPPGTLVDQRGWLQVAGASSDWAWGLTDQTWAGKHLVGQERINAT